MVELMGDSARGDDFALVRLRVDGDRIVDADAHGVAEDLRGLTLLEAAAVGGEVLPVDALANRARFGGAGCRRPTSNGSGNERAASTVRSRC